MTLRARFTLLSALALALGLWGFRAQVREGVLPESPEIADLSYPVRVEGRGAASPEELAFLVQPHPPGSIVTIEPADGAPPVTTTLRRNYTTPYYALTLFSGLYFWVVAAGFFGTRAGQPAVADFYGITVLYGLAVMVGGVYYTPDPYAPRLLLPLLQLGCLAFLPAIFVHLVLVFPVRWGVLDRRRWLTPLIWALPAAVTAWQFAVFWRYCRRPSPERFAAMDVPGKVADLAMVVLVALGFVLLFLGGRRCELTLQKKQVRWLLWGFIVGAAPYVFLRTLPQLLGLGAPLPAFFDRILELAVPTAFVFAVVYHRFLDIDIIIRRSLIYGCLAAGLAILVPLPVLTLSRRVAGDSPGWIPLATAACGLIGGLLFFPLRGAIGRWVDRTFFKIKSDYDKALALLATRADTASGQAPLAALADDFVARMLEPSARGVILVQGEALAARGDLVEGRDPQGLRDFLDAVPESGGTLAAPASTSLPEIESGRFPPRLAAEGAVLLQPVFHGEDRLGLLLLGPRATGRRYVEPDVDCLRKCAEIVGAAGRRIELVQSVALEALRRRQADELSRMKDDFLSRVAHDLRSPLASVDWSVRNLLDGLAGELGPKQRLYLESVGESSDHLRDLVNNLLEISRLDEAPARPELEVLPLAPLLETLRRTALPKAERRGVALTVRVEPPGLAVRGLAGRLRDALLNLVDNAIRYSPKDAAVELAAAAGDGRVEITVRDHGPGLGDLARPFDRYVQGDDSPYDAHAGFGLGLYIVREYVQLMGGDVEGGDAPGGGALFRIRLAAAAGERGART